MNYESQLHLQLDKQLTAKTIYNSEDRGFISKV